MNIQADTCLEETAEYRTYHQRRAYEKAVREEETRVETFRARLPQSAYIDRLQRVNSQRLIKWYGQCRALLSDCRKWDKHTLYMSKELHEIELDCKAILTDIAEIFDHSKRRGFVWYTDQWLPKIYAEELEQIASMSEWEHQLEARRQRADDLRDEE